ncbi:hypothetical protein BH10ACT1_BH10ACT1_01120 [soil metagenome]
MRPLFEEIDRQRTSMGEISLRRRWDPVTEVDVYEAKLDDEFLMSSSFTVAEVALATLGLAAVEGGELDVVVGGLGLGYTALAALADQRVRTLHVVEALGQVIEWHQRHLLPLSDGLAADPRCHLDHGDFFALVAAGAPFAPDAPERWHAILLDVDHSPSRILHPSHAGFYRAEGLRLLADRLHPDGVFALWSDDPPDADFGAVLGAVFAITSWQVVPFANPYTGGESTNTVYLASGAR